MRGSEGVSLGLHRPTKAVLALMLVVFTIWLVFAIGLNWGSASSDVFLLFTGNTERILHGEVWRLVTAPLLHFPRGGDGVSHIFWTLFGLYFLTPRLEEAWGAARLMRFIAISAIVAYTVQMAVELALPLDVAQRLVPENWFGLMPALEAVAIAWALTFKNERVMLFFVLPASSRMLIVSVVAASTLFLIAGAQQPQGLIAPFGGMLCGWLLGGGNPSPLRKLWLKLKLRRLDGEVKREQQKARRPNPAGLRAIPGGRSDDDDDRGPDGRFLN
jgi:membrane associated rhomboid family serine protease